MATDATEPSNRSQNAEASQAKPIPVEAGSDKAQTQPIVKPDSHHHGPESHHDLFPSERSFFSWLSVGLVGFASLVFALSAHHIFNPGLRPGDVADRDLKATHATLVIDEVETRKARDKARQSVMPVFTATAGDNAPTEQAVHALMTTVLDLQKLGLTARPNLKPEEQLKLLEMPDDRFAQNKAASAANLEALKTEREVLKDYKTQHPTLPGAVYLIALSVPDSSYGSYRASVEKSTQKICRVFRRLPEKPEAWIETAEEFLPETWNAELRRATAELICSQLRPNMEVDVAATEAKAEKLAAAVKPVMKEITVGQLIVAKHGTITDENIEVLQSMGVSDTNRLAFVLGLALSMAAAVLLVGLFLYALEPTHLFATSSIGLMYMVSIVVFSLSAIWGRTYPQLVPMPAAALILTIFLGQRVAIAVTLTMSIFLGVDGLIDFSNLVALGTAAGAAIGFYSRKRHVLMSTGLIMAAAQGIGYLAAATIQGNITPSLLAKGVTYEFGGGIVLAIVAIGSLPFLELIFGMLTPFRLAELTDADQPLLRKLEENAPGTYQHSLAVANLAEAGARSIGADVNLVRAGAYYHDVGKMVRPRYFIENQLGDKNPHDSMSPEDSKERVLAHVTDGIALAKEYGLPKAVQDFIPMHQGTSLMAYFYHKACLRDGADKVDPMFYRYPGPKPQTKETSIVMLADVSEAVTHSMKDPSQEEVEEAMSKVFQNRWDDGQFNESGLTYTELERVKKAFVHVWRTLHHERLKYPSTTTGRMAVPPDVVPAASTTSTVSPQEEQPEESAKAES